MLTAKAERALVELNWKADTGPLHQLIDDIRATNPAAMPQIAASWLIARWPNATSLPQERPCSRPTKAG